MMKKFFTTSVFVCLIGFCFAQLPAKYWVQFKYRDNGNYSIEKPEEFLSPLAIEKRAKFYIPITEQDIPVGKTLIDKVLRLDSTAVLLTTSKWLNGATFYSENTDFLFIMKEQDFVLYVEKTHIGKEPEIFTSENVTWFNAQKPVADIPNDLDYGFSYKQLEVNNIHWLHRLGFKGEGIMMQVQDGGFNNTDSIKHFKQIFEDNRVRAVKNFVQPEKSTFRDGTHGTAVLSCITSYIPGTLIGSAPACNFYLVQTEDTRSEFVIEEDYWVSGIEFADSLGIDIHTSSLGYTTFDDSTYYRTQSSLDGKTSRASIAADIAFMKGMLVINSAGNSGTDKWHYIASPADAVNVLTVGAVNVNGNKATFSSFGPTYDGRVKPDGAAVGWNTMVASEKGWTLPGSGTSFAAPLFAGMTACIRQAFPDRTNYDIINAIRVSGSQAAAPDSALGYGITDFLKVYNLLTNNQMRYFYVTIDNFVIKNKDKKISFRINVTKDMEVTLNYGLRNEGTNKSKTLKLKAGQKTVTMPISALPKGAKYDFFDLTISDSDTKYIYVLGRE